MKSLLFLAFAILFYLSFADNVAVWQGFQHQWERKALDVADTPHRMGSIANYITDEHYTSTTGYFRNHCHFFHNLIENFKERFMQTKHSHQGSMVIMHTQRRISLL